MTNCKFCGIIKLYKHKHAWSEKRNMTTETDYRGFYGDSQLLYDSVLIEIASRLNIIRKYKILNNERDPIESIKTRIKSPESMVKKLQGKGLVPIADNIPGNITDAAGARVICFR